MSRRSSLITFLAASFIAVATAGCPSTKVLDAKDPIDERMNPIVNKPAAPNKDSALETKLAQNRTKHLKQLRAYRLAKAFPINRYSPEIINVFRDDEGHLCAVANMIAKDGGYEAVIEETVKTNNNLRLADVHEGPLYDWILSSGFTQEEIAMIQAPYMPAPQLSLEEEQERIAERLAQVEERLLDDTELSLKVAASRFVQHREIASVE